MSIANNHVWDPLLYRTRCRTWPVPTGMTPRWRTTWLCVAPKRTSSWGQARVQSWRPACTQLTSYPGLYSRTACRSHYITQPGKLHFQLFTSTHQLFSPVNVQIKLWWKVERVFDTYSITFSTELCTTTSLGRWECKTWYLWIQVGVFTYEESRLMTQKSSCGSGTL